MKIVLLDRATLGMDTPLEALDLLGEVTSYNSTSPEEIEERVADAEVIIINKVKMTSRVIAAAKRLRLICVFATGFDNIDLQAARERGIAVCNVPGYSTESVALFTVATVTALRTHLGSYCGFVRSGEYTASGVPNRLVPVYHEIAGCTWGIVGYGAIGKAVGRIAEAFGARVLVNKRTPVEGASCVDLQTLARESDIITVHCPLTPETRGMIDRDLISQMKPNVLIVNEARGAVLNEEDITDAVLSGRIGGFGCDVYSEEPFPLSHPYNKIMHLDNVLLTPHSAWGAYEARARCMSVIVENIKSFYAGNSLNRVDK